MMRNSMARNSMMRNSMMYDQVQGFKGKGKYIDGVIDEEDDRSREETFKEEEYVEIENSFGDLEQKSND